MLAFAPDGRELFLGAGGCGAVIDLERGGATTLCRENERVVAGQTLFTIDDATYRNAVEQAEATCRFAAYVYPRREAGVEAPGYRALRDITKLRAEVRLAAPGALPNDGKVIEDRRSPA